MSNTSPPKLPEDITTDVAVLPDIETDNERAESLKKLADALRADYSVSNSTAIIEAAISIFEEILRLRPVGHEHRMEAARDLGNAIWHFCYHNKASSSRLARCFELLREVLQMCPPGHTARDEALHSLARALQFAGYGHHTGAVDFLRESVMLNRAALDLRPIGHPKRALSLDNLASGLARSFEYSGDVELLAEAIAMRREALRLHPLGDPSRYIPLRNLAADLQQSFEHQGGSEILAEAISLGREALQLQPVGSPDRWMTLSSLGLTLGLSFVSTGSPNSLHESTCLHREALQLMSSTHPERKPTSILLAERLVEGFPHNHDHSDLAEAIMLLRQSLCLPGGDYTHSAALHSLAEALTARFDEHRHLDDLHEALHLHREALKFRNLPGSYRRMLSLQRLGRLLCRPECQSWTEALTLYHEALNTSSPGSPIRAEVLSDTSGCFLEPESPFFDLYQGVAHLAHAYADTYCHVNRRLRMASSDLPRVERAYAKAITDLSPSTLKDCNDRLLDLYTQVVGLLPRAANFGLDHSTRLQAVTGLDEISRNAAARAILLGRESQALEMLEEGRGVFWAQTLHLRTSAFEDVPREDSEELQRLLRLLEYSARRAEGADQTPAQRERDVEKRRLLNEEAEALILKIRGYPSLDRFLLPPTFDALVGALPDGIVVMINASKLGYHALLLHKDPTLVTSLELRPPPKGFNSETMSSSLPRDLGLATREGDIRAMRKDSGRSNSFLDVLAVLWTSIVRPVLATLGLQEADGRARPRLWWCVTGELGFLPIHAAGNYRDANSACTADFVVSSYVPTLSSLTKARSSWQPISRTQLASLLVCEQSLDSERTRYLPEAANEVRIVRQCFASAGARVLNAPSAHTSLSTLRSLLEDTEAQILHLACHAIHNSDPLRSALVLQDGNLTVQDIMDLHLPNAVLAVLSACQTAKGDRNAPDQAIHLAASMLFCGFRSVIGTMWLMHDEDGPKVARALYEALFRSENLDLDDVPYALDEAVQVLRKAGVPAQRWALFMHMGG